MKDAQIGVIGLGTMGANLALNLGENGYRVALWARKIDVVQKLASDNPEMDFVQAQTLEQFVEELKPPRRVLLMVTAGPPVDSVIGQLKPLLKNGDIILDGGNSWFEDTRRRGKELESSGIHFIGMGVSGGEEGARKGPSLMPGGPKEAYAEVSHLLEAIAADTDSGPCVTWVGPDGAGHFVKMVHNGIEYGIMQLLAEVYDIMSRGLNLSPSEMAKIFKSWNEGILGSFLVEITEKVLRKVDTDTGLPLVDLVLDKAGQLGTGTWTAQSSLDLGVPVPTIWAALFARGISSLKSERTKASETITGPDASIPNVRHGFIDSLRDALYASEIMSYAQGMELIRAGSKKYEWDIDLMEVARIWKGGCIIRSVILDPIMQYFDKSTDNLLMDGELGAKVMAAQGGLREVIAEATGAGIPVVALSASLAYFDSYRTARLPQNLTQAQRDDFGAHKYERIDHPEWGPVHSEW